MGRAEQSLRVRTGIDGLDRMLGGGFLPGSANLVEGAPGTGKSTLGIQFIYAGAVLYNEPGIILTFEQFPHQFYQDAASFGWDLRALEADNKLRVVMSSPEVSSHDLRQTEGRIEQMIHALGVRRVLIDSLSHFERITSDPQELRELVFAFVNALKRLELTSLLTRESVALLGESPDIEEDLAYLVDSYVLLRYVELDSSLQKALLVLKQRGSAHAQDIRQFEIASNGLIVRSRFEGREGILSGNPQRMAGAFVEAFVRR